MPARHTLEPGYRIELLALDSASWTFLAVGLGLGAEYEQYPFEDAPSPVAAGVGAAGSLLGGAVTHAAHGRYLEAFGSAGLRVAGPIVMFMVSLGVRARNCREMPGEHPEHHDIRCHQRPIARAMGDAPWGLLLGMAADNLLFAGPRERELESSKSGLGRLWAAPRANYRERELGLELGLSF